MRVDGKFFAVDGERFRFRGTTYGTFRPRSDGHRFPEAAQVAEDFAAMALAGFTVVRTYTLPPADVIDEARRQGLRILAGCFFEDWRYLVGSSRRERSRSERHAEAVVLEAARQLAGRPEILAICLGNEIPADVVRWHGRERIAGVLSRLAELVHEVDPAMLVTYGNYPTTEHLEISGLDFVTFNVYLESRADFRRYLSRLQNLSGDRPLVLGEIGCSGAPTLRGEREQAELLDWQLEVAVERGAAGTCIFSWTDEWWVGNHAVEGWRFGLTDAERQPRPALAVAEKWNGMDIADLDHPWPSISVVICAHNEERWIDECLRHTCALDYPYLEILVVDDGSSDATAAIAGQHAGARVVSIPHSGLSVARNVGMEQASGELVAYLDADAYPTPEWPYYLALGLDGPNVGGSGGPNVAPESDGTGAQKVVRSPGGPVHVLTSDDRAEHVPGCNMAFWKPVLEEVGGFDPVYRAAGDDVDLCWRVLDRGWEIGFHPAALVWHHRRTDLRAYLRQQRGYGKAEALVEARHPDRFGKVGGARWRGHVYGGIRPLGSGPVYRGIYGQAPYQSVYRANSDGIELLQQVGVPASVLALPTAAAGLVEPVLAAPALAAALLLVTLFLIDVRRVDPPAGSGAPLRFRLAVALHRLLQPLARTWGRRRHSREARRERPMPAALPAEARAVAGGTLLMADDRPRGELAGAAVEHLRRAGYHVSQVTGWEDHDGQVAGSFLLHGELVTSCHPHGAVQVRVRRRPNRMLLTAATVAVACALALTAPLGAALLLAGTLDITVGLWRTGPRVRRVLRQAGNSPVEIAVSPTVVLDVSGPDLDTSPDAEGRGDDLRSNEGTAEQREGLRT